MMKNLILGLIQACQAQIRAANFIKLVVRNCSNLSSYAICLAWPRFGSQNFFRVLPLLNVRHCRKLSLITISRKTYDPNQHTCDLPLLMLQSFILKDLELWQCGIFPLAIKRFTRLNDLIIKIKNLDIISDFITVSGFYQDRYKKNVSCSYFLNKKFSNFNSKINKTTNISVQFHQFIPNNFFS